MLYYYGDFTRREEIFLQVVFTNVLILFMLLFLGYLIGIKKIVAHSSINDLTNLVVDVSMPCTIALTMVRPFDARLLGDAIKVMVAILIFQLVLSGLAYYATKILKVNPSKSGSWIFALVFSNNAFVGYPLMYALYGNDGLFLMAMGNVVQNVLIFSLGIKLITLNYNLKDHIRLRHIIFTKQNIAVVVGEKEMESGLLSVRSRDEGELGQMSVEDFLAKVNKQIADRENVDVEVL